MAAKGSTRRTEKDLNEILDRISAGEKITHICSDDHLPCEWSVRKWRRNDHELDGRFWAAMKQGVLPDIEAWEARLDGAKDRDETLKADKMLAHLRWKAERLLEGFQDKQSVEVEHIVVERVVGWREPVVIEGDVVPILADDAVSYIPAAAE